MSDKPEFELFEDDEPWNDDDEDLDINYADWVDSEQPLCEHCSGTGQDWDLTPCPFCDGEGYKWWLP